MTGGSPRQWRAVSFYSILYSGDKRNCKRTSRGAPPDVIEGNQGEGVERRSCDALDG